MKLRIEKSVTVITPTIGSHKLRDAMEGVRNQTYKSTKHLIVVDGPQYFNKAVQHIEVSNPDPKVQLSVTPENTGANGFYGHRIYASYPHLINSEYVAFLDEDNWYDPEHIESLVSTIESKNLNFAYSMRKIHNSDGNFLIEDNCESLGKWPIWHNKEEYLVDTSSYLFKRDFLVQTCNLWHFGWGGDRRFFSLIKDRSNHDSSRKHTLCYRLDGNEGSVKESFFINGNNNQNVTYNGKLPWKTF